MENENVVEQVAPVEISFSKVVEGIIMGQKFSRLGWNGKGMYIGMQRPDENSKNTLPYIYMITATGDRVPWVASHSDILAFDWVNIQ